MSDTPSDTAGDAGNEMHFARGAKGHEVRVVVDLAVHRHNHLIQHRFGAKARIPGDQFPDQFVNARCVDDDLINAARVNS